MTAQRDATLTPRHHQAIDLLVSGRDQGDVARALHVDRTTVWRWGRMPEFARALAAAEADAHRAHARTLGHAARAAALFLASVLGDQKVSIGVRMQAGSVLLSKWAQLQPSQVRADVAMAVTSPLPDVDTGDALAELRRSLDGINDRRERSEIVAQRPALAPAGGNGR